MEKKIYNKLVRDKIPEIIKTNGEDPLCRILNESEYVENLFLKLHEETEEARLATDEEILEELADIYEVFKSICNVKDVDFDDVIKCADEKNIKKGSFKDRIFLESVVR